MQNLIYIFPKPCFILARPRLLWVYWMFMKYIYIVEMQSFVVGLILWLSCKVWIWLWAFLLLLFQSVRKRKCPYLLMRITMCKWLTPLLLCFSDLLLFTSPEYFAYLHSQAHNFLCVFWQQEEGVKFLHFLPWAFKKRVTNLWPANVARS